MVEGRASEFDFIQLHFFHGDIRDSRKYDTFRRKKAVLFINLLGKGSVSYTHLTLPTSDLV